MLFLVRGRARPKFVDRVPTEAGPAKSYDRASIRDRHEITTQRKDQLLALTIQVIVIVSNL